MPTFLQDWLNALLAAMGGATATFIALRRQYSKDSASIAHDKGESNLIATLIVERDAATASAHEAWTQRLIDVGRIARLDTLMESAEREITQLRNEAVAMQIYIREMSAIVAKLDPQAATLLHMEAKHRGIDLDYYRHIAEKMVADRIAEVTAYLDPYRVGKP